MNEAFLRTPFYLFPVWSLEASERWRRVFAGGIMLPFPPRAYCCRCPHEGDNGQWTSRISLRCWGICCLGNPPKHPRFLGSVKHVSNFSGGGMISCRSKECILGVPASEKVFWNLTSNRHGVNPWLPVKSITIHMYWAPEPKTRK